MMGLADLIEERCGVLCRLVLTLSPFSDALVHMFQLLQHLLVQMGLVVHGRQCAFTFYCGKDADAILHHLFRDKNRIIIINLF